jgi:DNA-directed RNA polymerase subunit H
MHTLRKMLARRGYDVPTPSDFTQDTLFSYLLCPPTKKQSPPCLVACAHDLAKVGVGVVRDITKLMQTHACSDTILVAEGLTPNASTEARSMMRTRLICTIQPKTLVFDWYEHKSVPRHELLHPDARADLLKSFKVKPSQLPSIFLDDPACKYMGAHIGDIFKITRVRPNVGEDIAYRHVIAPE